jgi:hypothetical protein
MSREYLAALSGQLPSGDRFVREIGMTVQSSHRPEWNSPLCGKPTLSSETVAAALESRIRDPIHGTGHKVVDPLIESLVERLPVAESAWSLDDRVKWLRTAISIFALVYHAGDDNSRDINVELLEKSRTKTPNATEASGVKLLPSD